MNKTLIRQLIRILPQLLKHGPKSKSFYRLLLPALVMGGIALYGMYFSSQASPQSSQLRENLLDHSLSFTDHGSCRMDCRHISKSEINETLKKGTLNKRKSKFNDKPCPSYAVEHFSQDGQNLRVVFGDCPSSTKVITAIDLGNKWECNCR